MSSTPGLSHVVAKYGSQGWSEAEPLVNGQQYETIRDKMSENEMALGSDEIQIC